jgi:hypothetical protein
MQSHIQLEVYDDEDLPGMENRLKDQGYRLVEKVSEADLNLREYIKKSFPISSRSALYWRVE